MNNFAGSLPVHQADVVVILGALDLAVNLRPV